MRGAVLFSLYRRQSPQRAFFVILIKVYACKSWGFVV